VLPLILLLAGLACALVSRVLLCIAAINISIGWALGVFLPFGPFFFHRTFPEEAKRSMMFRRLTLPFLLLYLIVESGMGLGFRTRKDVESVPSASNQTTGYGMEHPAGSQQMSSEGRRVANTKELDRLAKWSEVLRLRKRDLLKSDVEGNHAYEAELALYNDALAKATAEKNALATPPNSPESRDSSTTKR
jgi:hypothetical protein